MPRSQTAQRTYRKNYLTDVILKINFPVILAIAQDTPKDFQQKIITNYPILEPLQEFEIKIENKGINIAEQKKSRTIWKFRNRDSTESIELDSGSLAYISKKYTTYTDFKSKAQEIFVHIFELYPSIVIDRLGLRYINQIHLDDQNFFQWDNYLNENLIKNIDFFSDKTKIKRLINIAQLAQDDDTNLKIQYGLFNSTYPSKIVKKEFILDYDCSTTLQFEKDQVFSKAYAFHGYIKSYFENSITEDFRTLLNNE